jgi:hypothetical protein
MQPNRNDHILSVTRITAAIIVPVLLIAFVILFFFPHESARYFAFPVQPTLMAIYVGGAWLFVRVLVGRRWHAVAAGFPAITTFTVSMLGATLWHWGPFDLTHVPFLVWLGL